MKPVPVAVAAVVGFALACDITSGPVTPAILADASGSGTCSNANRITRNNELYQGKWNCGTRANVYVTVFGGGSPNPYLSPISTAVSRWNTALFNAYNLPRLGSIIGGNPAPSDPGPYVQVEVRPSAGGGDWCGRAPSTVILYQGAANCSAVPFAVLSNLPDIATHELGHAQGFDHPKDRTIVALHSCIMYVPDQAPSPYNTTPCMHESQSVYWAYSLRNTSPGLTAPMFGAGVTLTPASATIQTGATQQFAAASSAGEDNPPPDLAWSIDNPGIATFANTSNTSALVQAGQSTGQAVVTAKILEAPWITWPTSSGSATLTVQPPPPPPVASVTITPNGVTLVGATDATLTATARDAQGNVIPNVTFTWSVRDTAIIYFVPSGGVAWISAKKNGSTTVWARASNGVTAAITVTVQGCPVRCYA